MRNRMSYYSQKEKEQIAKDFFRFQVDKSSLGTISMLLQQIAPPSQPKSDVFKFSYYGVGRRLRIMEQCVKNVFKIRPIESDTFPTETERFNLTINLQCFLINLYGTLENLARIYAIVINFKGTKFDFSFFAPEKKEKQTLLKTLPQEVQDAFVGDGKWLTYIKSFRDLLVHQEPFYIPPNSVNMSFEKEWRALEQEKQQVLDNWLKAVLELAQKEITRNANNLTPSIEELNAETKLHNELEAKRDAETQAIIEKQREYEIFIPMIVTDTRDMQQPIMYFYPQMLCDMKTVYEKVILILRLVLELKITKHN